MSMLSDLNDLISQAHAALEDVDSFDIDEADPASADDFASLGAAHREDVTALVAFVTENSTAILAALK